MANYHTEFKNISRIKKEGGSIVRLLSYISGVKLYDSFKMETYSHDRNDVEFFKIFMPIGVPPEFNNLQVLCNKINQSEKRYDARTGRHFICSLPNELPLEEQICIVQEFAVNHFLSNGLCVIAAIHKGANKENYQKNNPHAHLIVSTRTIDSNGFNPKKDREHNKREYANIWREGWAKEVNKAYERNDLEIRVSHESLEVQGINDREPICHLSQKDWQKEQKGERTYAGDRKRSIQEHNRKIQSDKERDNDRELEIELSR